MPNVWMMSFDWGGFSEILATPAADLAGRLAEWLRRNPALETPLPRDESGLVEFLRPLLAAEDWYAGKSPRESRAIDGFIDYLFDYQEPLKPMKFEPLNDGVTWGVLGIAKGTLEPHDAGNTPRSRQIYLKKVEPPPETDLEELADLGFRPFRHPAWDRRAAESSQNNPFIHGLDATYSPDYSIHSPEQVLTLREELARAGERLRRQLDRVPSKRVREEVLANFENDLAGPIEKAAASRRAVYARQDY